MISSCWKLNFCYLGGNSNAPLLGDGDGFYYSNFSSLISICSSEYSWCLGLYSDWGRCFFILLVRETVGSYTGMSSIYSAFDAIVNASNWAFLLSRYEINISINDLIGLEDSLLRLTNLESPSYNIRSIFVIVRLSYNSSSNVWSDFLRSYLMRYSRMSALTCT